MKSLFEWYIIDRIEGTSLINTMYLFDFDGFCDVHSQAICDTLNDAGWTNSIIVQRLVGSVTA